MAPLRERLAQESAFEAGKTFDSRAFSKAVICTTNGFAKGLLKNQNKREMLKDMCQYKQLGGRSVLASVCLAATCVEKAIVLADNCELRNAELEQAERLLEIPAFPNRCEKTSGVSSSFLCALAHLYLALVWKIRQNDNKVALHFLEMFIASPGSARDALALILWEQLFLPRFSDLEAWYHKEVNIILNQQAPVAQEKEVIPPPHSFEALYADLRGFWQQWQPSNSRSGSLGQLRLEREDRLEVLKMLYQESLDENTRKFAECYKAAIIYNKKSLNFPAVELPEIRVQIVQRQVLSRKNLAKVSSAKTHLLAKTLLSKARAEKENISPKDENVQLKKLHRNGRLARIFAEQSQAIGGSILDGTELDEMELLRVWSCPSEAHSLTCAHSRASGIEHSESGVFSLHTSSSSSTGQQVKRTCKTNGIWQDKLPALTNTGSPIEKCVHTPVEEPTKESLCPITTQGKGVVRTAAISPKILTRELNVTESAGDLSKSIQKTRLPLRSTLECLGSGNNHYYESSEEASKNASDLQFTPKYRQQGSCDKSSEISEKVVAGLKQAVATLCTAEDLQESEQVVPVLARVWMESKGNSRIEAFMTEAAVVDVLVEFLSISKSEEVQRATVCLLADLVYKNDFVRDKVIDFDPKVKWVGSILQQRQIPQAAVLLYLLKLHPLQLASLNIIPTLLEILRDSSSDTQVLRAPKAAATFLLEELVSSFDDLTNLQNAALVVHLQAIPHLLHSFASEIHEVQISALVILSFCMRADGKCRSHISVHCKPSSLVQLMKCSDSRSRTVITAFLCDLLRLNK